MSVGHIWKYYLEKTFSLDFGENRSFSKNPIEHVMLRSCTEIGRENPRGHTKTDYVSKNKVTFMK